MDTVPFVASNRPRTLVAAIDEREVAAMVIGPWAEPVTPWARADVSENPLVPLWELVEELGVDFDRISAACDVRDRAELAVELARQSLRPARVAGVTELAARSVVESRGIELVLSLGERFGAALFVDGVAWPSFALGAHRFRKGMTYAEYLAGDVADRLGRRKWNKRALRAVEQLLAVFAPRKLYVTGRDAALVHDEPTERVEVVREDRALAGAIALWR
ncbi:MAG TPA: hypothetical protein VH143_07070 [Kofleriaceae bacterium]|nr:hypothetical protein [Kofleriaceae bacterium]